MSQNMDSWRQRVRAIMPDLGNEPIELNQDGLINDVVVVNNERVFRFAKNEEYAEILKTEAVILDLIRPRVGIPVPNPTYAGHGYMMYPLLRGEPLLRDTIVGLDEETQSRLAGQLGAFLHGLHTTPVADAGRELPATRAPVTRGQWLELRGRVQERVYPLLLPHQVQWAEALFGSALDEPGFFDYVPALIHGDLAPYHILFDRQSSKITGVLDFGVAGTGDAALDIGGLMTAYGESLVTRMQRSCPGLDTLVPRARFYAQSIELQWALLGIETGGNFWFTAHLGGARDILG